MAESMRVTCLECGQANRVPADRLVAGPKCGVCGAPLISGKVTEIETETLMKAEKDDLPLLVDFWAPWCGPCRQIAPALEALSQKMGDRVTVAKVNIDENPGVPGQYGVRGIPTLMLFKKGELVATKVGAMPQSKILEWVESEI